MQDFFNAIKLEERRAALRLSVGDFCRRVGMHPSTWEKARAGHEPRLGTARNVIRVLEAEELTLLRHLIGLHPDKAREMLAATPPASPGGGVNTPSDAAAAGPLCGERAQMEDVA